MKLIDHIILIHVDSLEMYRDLRRNFWWTGMKKQIAEFVKKCLTCQQIKAEHKQPSCLLQPLPIPVWKWEHITMHFVRGLPITSDGMDSIWIVVDRITKTAQFVPVRTSYSVDKPARLYVSDVVQLHGVPLSITSDMGAQFISAF